ncbi:MAG TPA: sigma 54-interacting transcriptional regulator [Selenomonadales bacterium]|nr:sigma 54-interacting transcriptional regulator [Selenomonadales bacterium]
MPGEETLRDLLQLNIVKNIFNALEDGIIIVDPSCRVLFYNQAVSRAEGLDSTDVVGKSLFDVFPSLTPEDSTLYQVAHSGTPIQGRFQQYFNYKGRQLKTLNTTIPILENGAIIGALEVSRDISVVVALTEKVAELRGARGDRTKPGSGVRYTFDQIIGGSKKIRHLSELLGRVSRTSSSVFLYGETGTGKELFAQSIHNAGPRRNKPFVAQNCAALPESILEGILFGTTKGSFTGALDKPGLFEQAQGGTILLDEINSMGVALQAKILRVLQEGVVRRLGGGEDIAVDVRIIVTANERPEDLLRAGKLREDLYYRLNVIYAEIPPLRERREDLDELTGFFIRKYNRRFQKDVSGVDAGLGSLFRQYSWPGNIRELEHVIEALMNVADEGQLTAEHLSYLGFGAFKDFLQTMAEPQPGDLREDVQEYEKVMIGDVLRQCEGNVSRAARKLGMKRQALQYRLRKYGIRPERQ